MLYHWRPLLKHGLKGKTEKSFFQGVKSSERKWKKCTDVAEEYSEKWQYVWYASLRLYSQVAKLFERPSYICLTQLYASLCQQMILKFTVNFFLVWFNLSKLCVCKMSYWCSLYMVTDKRYIHCVMSRFQNKMVLSSCDLCRRHVFRGKVCKYCKYVNFDNMTVVHFCHCCFSGSVHCVSLDL